MTSILHIIGDTVIDYGTSEFYRGYTICRRICGVKRDFVGMKDTHTWFEAGTREELKTQIDTALDEE